MILPQPPYVTCINNATLEGELTLQKQYPLDGQQPVVTSLWYLKNDVGRVGAYYKYRFVNPDQTGGQS